MDDRAFRLAVLVSAHAIFLSAAALRIIRGSRGHRIRSQSTWFLQYYPPLVWVPFLVAHFFPVAIDLPLAARYAGVAIALASALFAAWAMWSLGRSYGIRMDLFDEHRLVTSGPYRLTRHPMYLGIIGFHLGAILAMESALLLAATVLLVIPFTLARIRSEELVLIEGFGDDYRSFAGRVGRLVPLVR